ncbi:MAG: tRNA (adenosine(37)-N6)-threonylcarbamoyltransferase complex dimerization subunit type 1 TsaB [Phycisphaerae bacterium]|nr:tRNA (adenosine(37)-N6)-threonylcarbamoyltransferase complex dimerization subunit type 1 TsaB [Phycisphaerae bacterium]
MTDRRTVTVAMETSCRAGGLLLAVDGHPQRVVHFDAAGRHTTHLLTHLAAMVAEAGLHPADIDEVYVSAGPGSFTGVRVGITVARTLAQAVGGIRCVAVPTPAAVAENARALDWRHLAVVLDAREGCFHATLFARQGERIEPVDPPGRLWEPDAFLTAAPRPLLLTGEGLAYHVMAAPGVSFAAAELHLPTAEGVYAVGSRLAAAGQFTEYHRLLPVYARSPHITGPAGEGGFHKLRK